MKVPSLKRLEENFPGCGKMLRAILDGTDEPTKYCEVELWVNSCRNTPRLHDQKMRAFDAILDGFGVEAVMRQDVFGRADYEYINTGDAYNPTIIWDDVRKSWFIETWADFQDKARRRGIKFEGDEE